MEWRLNHVGQMAQSVQDYSKDRRYVEKQKISQEILYMDDEEKLRKIKRILDE